MSKQPSSDIKSSGEVSKLGDYSAAAFLGLVRAMVMIATTQPLFNIKTIQQTNAMPFKAAFDLMQKNIRQDGFFNSAYRGSFASLTKMGFGSAITTPTILLASDLLKDSEFERGNPIAATLAKSLIVAAGKTVTTPFDSVITRMIKEGKDASQVLKDNFVGRGLKLGAVNLFRGATAEAIKNFISANGTFAIKGITASDLSQLDKTLASAAIIAATVVTSHPFDTFARKQQGAGKESLTIGQTLKEMSDLSRRSSNGLLRQYFFGLLPKAAATAVGLACNVAALHLIDEFRAARSKQGQENSR